MDLNTNPTRSNFRNTFCDKLPNVIQVRFGHVLWCPLRTASDALFTWPLRAIPAGANGGCWGRCAFWGRRKEGVKFAQTLLVHVVSSPEMTSEVPNRKVPNTIFHSCPEVQQLFGAHSRHCPCGLLIFPQAAHDVRTVRWSLRNVHNIAVETMLLLPFYSFESLESNPYDHCSTRSDFFMRFVGHTGFDLMNVSCRLVLWILLMKPGCLGESFLRCQFAGIHGRGWVSLCIVNGWEGEVVDVTALTPWTPFNQGVIINMPQLPICRSPPFWPTQRDAFVLLAGNSRR